jgi:hypothetical protein
MFPKLLAFKCLLISEDIAVPVPAMLYTLLCYTLLLCIGLTTETPHARWGTLSESCLEGMPKEILNLAVSILRSFAESSWKLSLTLRMQSFVAASRYLNSWLVFNDWGTRSLKKRACNKIMPIFNLHNIVIQQTKNTAKIDPWWRHWWRDLVLVHR